MRIGIDVGGTNTDAVLMDGLTVLAEVKTATTPDVTSGIVTGLRNLVADAAIAADAVQAVMIGTTHFTNAVVEAKRLTPVAAVRIALPATGSLPPMIDWPVRLHEAVGGHFYLCRGGYEVDGRAIAPLDHDELRRVAGDIATKGIGQVAVTAVFSPLRSDLEQEAAEIITTEYPEALVSLSHEIGRIGLLERESATIINASLQSLGRHIVAAFENALADSGIDAPVYLSQNDGTLMGVRFAERYPVLTFASGPTNSMRGAAFLTSEANCVVVDIGGTTSDVGLLVNGFPRDAMTTAEIGGVRTNFRMPDVLSLGLGGGSLVRARNGGDNLTIGPDSVGYELASRALAFGGDTLTATDLAVAGGLVDIGDRSLVRHLDRSFVSRGLRFIEHRIAETVDMMKTSPDPVPVVVVGGGSILLRDALPGAGRLIRPEHFGVANAIGAAIAQVGGEVDQVYPLDGAMSRHEAIVRAKEEATRKAAAAGAIPSTIQIVDVEDVALNYLPSTSIRVKVKAVGDLELGTVDRAQNH